MSDEADEHADALMRRLHPSEDRTQVNERIRELERQLAEAQAQCDELRRMGTRDVLGRVAKAARALALEEAARVADREAESHNPRTEFGQVAADVALEIAACIRALDQPISPDVAE